MNSAWVAIRQGCQKFYHLSPYAYCAGDPVNLVDPEGRKIYFAKGVPEWFKERYYATIEYMKETGTYDLVFRKLEEDDNFVVYIDYIETISEDNSIRYNYNNNTIYWNPNIFIESKKGIYLFPATILAHEGAHALQDKRYTPEKREELMNTTDNDYENLIEKEVITTIEKEVAILHEDIKEGEITRTNHGAINIYIYDTKKYYYIAAEYYRELIIERIRQNNK